VVDATAHAIKVEPFMLPYDFTRKLSPFHQHFSRVAACNPKGNRQQKRLPRASQKAWIARKRSHISR
jgi:hypothetical protein